MLQLQQFCAAHLLPLKLYFTQTHERQAEMRQRNEVARCTHRTLHIDNRTNACVEEVDEALHGDQLTTGIAVAEGLYLEEKHDAYNVARHTVATATSMAHHEIDLQLGELVLTDADVAE